MTFELQHDVPLAPRTTLQVGGTARYLTVANSVADLRSALQWAQERGTDVRILGGGSNVLVADSGFAGLVIQPAWRDIAVQRAADGVHLTVQAGVIWDDLVGTCVDADWAGVECLSGIPGWVGATPVQNVGAYGQDVASCITAVQVLQRDDLTLRRLPAAACGFAYRSSHFKHALRDTHVIVAVEMVLHAGGKPTLLYPDLRKALGPDATLGQTREAVLRIRRDKSMLLDVTDANHRSAGSFFTNPVVSLELAQRLQRDAAGGMPQYPHAAQQIKLSAAWLIERAGFQRGFVDGPVGLSSKHALALVNRGGAQAHDVRRLAARITTAVQHKFGVLLTPEPVFIGADN